MFKLFVIAGHGNGDVGAIGYDKNGKKFYEYERVRMLAKRIKELGGSNVILGDLTEDYYKSEGILNLKYKPNEIQIIELHMDGSEIKTARGSHVIIIDGAKPDVYDTKLANSMNKLLPGRADIIQYRSDLQNVNLANYKGYGYRLLECGFISNVNDLDIFNKNIDTISKIILESFGFKSESPNPSKPSKPSKPTTTTFKVGDKVGVKKDAKDYNGNPAGGVTRNKVMYTIDELIDDRAVLDLKGICTAFHTKDLIKKSSSTSSKPKMTERQFALEVWNEGKHSTGEKRKQECEKYGVDYDEVQRLIGILDSGGKI